MIIIPAFRPPGATYLFELDETGSIIRVVRQGRLDGLFRTEAD
jgi:hypothetical protein